MAQTDSAIPGFRRTTLEKADASFVHDADEYSLRLVDLDPKRAVGTYGIGGKICAIEGQDPASYLAVDVGSEMPAYEVFRAEKQAPFDWRHAAFGKMRLEVPEGPAANKETTDASVIADVIATLRDGTVSGPPTIETSGSLAPVHSLALWSDQLPGLVFSPAVYFDSAGQVFLAESLTAVEFRGNVQVTRARWKPASASFTRWSHSAD